MAAKCARATAGQSASNRLSWCAAQPRLEINGLPLLCSGCANSGWIEGRTVAIEYRWAEGRTGARPPKSPPNSSGSRWMSLLPTRTRQPAASKAGSINYSDCIRRRRDDPVGTGLVAISGAARRQCHRLVAPADRPRRQAPRAPARTTFPISTRLAILANSWQSRRGAARWAEAGCRRRARLGLDGRSQPKSGEPRIFAPAFDVAQRPRGRPLRSLPIGLPDR